MQPALSDRSRDRKEAVVILAIAFLAGLGVTTRLGRSAGLNTEAVTNLAVYCALSAIVVRYWFSEAKALS